MGWESCRVLLLLLSHEELHTQGKLTQQATDKEVQP